MPKPNETQQFYGDNGGDPTFQKSMAAIYAKKVGNVVSMFAQDEDGTNKQLTAGGEGADTNMANTDLVVTGERLHDLGGNFFELAVSGPSAADGEINLLASGGQLFLTGSSTTLTSPGTGKVVIESTELAVDHEFVGIRNTLSSGTTAPRVRFYEKQSSGSDYVSLRAVDNLTASTDYVLPAADGTAGQVLSTDGNGNLSWVNN